MKPNSSPRAAPAVSPETPRLRAVIVDDEPAARRGVRLLLERDRGVDVVGEAASGAEAAELIRRERPDLAFLDVQMPGGDGFAALAQLGPGAVPAVFVRWPVARRVAALRVRAVVAFCTRAVAARGFAPRASLTRSSSDLSSRTVFKAGCRSSPRPPRP